ncbi:hypothetical protein [Caulobacter sp. 1776]|uniref:hypothetical protein n=1 Tax=Caulobacter sp. 1776 TaxID=3156420 RepID=UPI003397E399
MDAAIASQSRRAGRLAKAGARAGGSEDLETVDVAEAARDTDASIIISVHVRLAQMRRFLVMARARQTRIDQDHPGP